MQSKMKPNDLSGFLALPMYDWPEIKPANDRFAMALVQAITPLGIAVDPVLRRGGDPHTDWLRPDLVLSQTCGLPYVRQLEDKVCLLGAPSYDIDCPAGHYRSLIIGPEDETQINWGKPIRFAYNDERSQSGFSALIHWLKSKSVGIDKLIPIKSGSHRKSIKLVADGRADIAAIDSVCWALSSKFDRFASMVSVMDKTVITPGLPYITSLKFKDHKEPLFEAISEAIDRLDEDTKQDLLLTGFTQREAGDYQIIKQNWLDLKLSDSYI